MKTDPIKIALSMGDAAGIGPEVALKALSSPEIRKRCLPVLIGSARVYQGLASRLKLSSAFEVISDIRDAKWPPGGITILQPPGLPEKPPPPAKLRKEWAEAAMRCIETGVAIVRAGQAHALVTAPINKEGIHRAGYRFAGHTDYLAHLTGARRWAMMLVGGRIRVVLATVHLPLARVSAALKTAQIADKIRLADQAMRTMGIASPRIAVAGLNPHAGEGGVFGREEKEIIAPAVARCRREGLAVEGPLPPDTLFYNMYHGRYDVAVAMYHDQGLIPLKMLAFEEGVNVTLGLPIIRTSPDHGTAYEIAGRGVANPNSMKQAIRLACQLASLDQAE